MTDYHEIVDLGQFGRAVQALAVVVPVVAILIGLIVGAARRQIAAGLTRGVAIGLLGPIVYGLWVLYSYNIRMDPKTGTVGLHHVSVLLLNVAIFAVVGVVLGLAYRRVFRAAPATEATEPAVHPE